MCEDTEKLYLCKLKNKEVIVDDIECLSRHNINGIRFLYLQFVKKHSGVILNDPALSGKCLLTASFLKAIQHLLLKPILIITIEEDFNTWNEYLKDLDVVIRSKNPLARRKVFINSSVDATSFSVKDWSIIVVHDNYACKEILKTEFKADFKIWITSVDLKANLNLLHSIYYWITKENFNIKQFTPDRDAHDQVKKSIQLDTFLEDIYFRSYEYEMPAVLDVDAKTSPAKSETIEQRKKKNKDATGTKTKRSKRRLDDDDLPDIPDDSKNTTERIGNSKSLFSSDTRNVETTAIIDEIKLDVNKTDTPESIKLDATNVEIGDNNGNVSDKDVINEDNAKESARLELNNGGETTDMETESQDIFSFSNAVQDIIKNENDTTITDTQEECIKLQLESESIDLNNVSQETQSIDSKLLELEQMALKKFKGSILDSIF